MKKDVAVIGLGVFGYEVAVTLQQRGHTVLVVDRDRKIIDSIKDLVSAAVIANATDETALQQLDIAKFDIVILGLASSLESMVLGVTLLKKLGVKWIIARANSTTQEEILKKIGADEVVMPERQSARRLAEYIALPNIVDIFDLDAEMSLAEVRIDENLAGKTLFELNLRKKHNVLALMMKRSGGNAKLIISPETTLQQDDIVIVAGKQSDIEKCFG